MTVLEQDEVKQLCKVMNYILKTTNTTVEKVKEKFHLSDDEYNMIMNISMPFLREANSKKYWYAKHHSLIRKISDLGSMKKLSDEKFRKLVLAIVNDKSANEPYMRDSVGDDVDELDELNDTEIEEIEKKEIPILRAHSINI